MEKVNLMSMNVNAKLGDQIVFAHPEDASRVMREIAMECLELGRTYTVGYVKTEDWGTDVYIEDIGGEIALPTTLFDDAS